MKVFISHTYEIARFPEEHPFLRAALDGAREAGWAIDEMEDFPAASAPPAAECERRVRACDAFVAIIGFLWGSEVPENPGLSYVEFEFESALAARKPTLVFVIDEQATGFPAGLTEGMSARERDLQKAFRRRIVAEAGAKGLIYKKLTEPHKLQHAVFRSLSELRPSNEHPSVPQPTPKTRVSTERLPAVGGTLFGRDDLLRQLDDAWRTRQANVVCLIGPAGAGKTALTNNWLSSLAAEKYRDASAVFAWSFDSQEVDQSEVSADKFVTELFKFCGEHEPPMNATERGRRLAQIVSSQAVILVLDGIEAAQDPREPHELKDPAVRVLLRMLAAQNTGLCLVSSVIEIDELLSWVDKTVKLLRVEELSDTAGTALLKNMRITGPAQEFVMAVHEYQGNAMSLTLLGACLRRYKGGDIRRRKDPDVIDFSDTTGSIRHIEQWLGRGPELEILRLLGLFNHPAHLDVIDAICVAPAIPDLTDQLIGLSKRRRRPLIGNLRDLKLLLGPSSDADEEIDTNASFRQQWALQLREQYPSAWRDANSRLFDYYAGRPSENEPDTLDEMTPLFQAVVHGCRANRHQEAFTLYWNRIRRGEDGYSVTNLNAWGADLVAVSNFFVDGDWERPSVALDDIGGARACTEAAFDLRGHGRLDEAISAQVIGLRRHVELGNWWSACDAAGNLSELQTLHGDLKEAETAARRSIEFAGKAATVANDDRDRNDARLTLSTNLATLGDVLHQRGQYVQAEEEFRSAERTFCEVKRDLPYLHLLRGYHYCDLLLSLRRLPEVETRAAFAAASDVSRPYGVALAHLAMARCRTALLKDQRATAAGRREARAQMDDACSRLRQTGHSEMILRGLLASAELHRMVGEFDDARTELDEVLERASHVQMKLLEADARLQLAYLETNTGNADRARVHLDISRGMIQAFSYERRASELQDIESLLQSAQSSKGVCVEAHPPLAVTPSSIERASSLPFEEAQRRFIDLFLRCNPLEGTQLGIAGSHDAKLPIFDARVRADLFAELTASAHALRAVAESSGAVDDIVDGELAVAGIRGLRIGEDALQPSARNPGVYLDAVARSVYTLLARTDLAPEQKAEPLVERLVGIPELLRRGQRQLSRTPQVFVDNARGDAQGVLEFLQNDLDELVNAVLDGQLKQDLIKGRQQAIEAVQVFSRFIDGLTATATDQFAIGRTAFEALLRDVHQVNQDAAELRELGNSVVAELEADLERASIKAKGDARWWESVADLESRYPARGSLLDDYRIVLSRAREFVERHDLIDLGRVGPLIVRATPSFARANLPFAAYIPAPPFASSGSGEFWVTTPSDGILETEEHSFLRRHHRGRLVVACVHEAYPGHHSQFDHAAHVKRPLRHFFASNVFSEGWGLYCEDLMRREGFMIDGAEGAELEISMLRDQLWRALRIIIDVGLHCEGMTRDEAVALLVDRHVLGGPSAEAEVMYYCSAPTQPMSYMVGRILMSQLIERCRATSRDQKPLGRIRDEVLSHGSLPFPLLERLMGFTPIDAAAT